MGIRLRRFQRRMIDLIAGRKAIQGIAEFLLYTSIRCMNYNNGAPMDKNGELYLLREIYKKYKDKDTVVFFDVGANVGHYSEAIVQVFGKKAFIHAFEPSEKTFESLEETTKNMNNIVINNIGLSDEEKLHILYTKEGSSYLASVYNRTLDHHQITLDQTEEIRLSTIDRYCKENNIEKIDYLKLDVEGHEFNILQGSKRMIEEGRIDHIQFEFGGGNLDSRTFFHDFYSLLKDKYKIYRILVNGIKEIPSYTEGAEIFHLINFLAIRKEID